MPKAPPAVLTRLGKYQVVRPLGGGGMGDVYLSRLTGPGGFSRDVALKVIRPAYADDARYVDLFLREGRLLAQLSHRTIVQVFELASEDGQLYLAMEHLDGFNLRQLLTRLGRARWPLAAYACAEIAAALGAAHELRHPEAPHGLLHRDLSPSNVIVCFDGAVKVLDFGLARPTGHEASNSGVHGKVAYLAPEVFGRAELDHGSDLYALGVILYELITGQLPFHGRNDAETMMLIRSATPPRPSSLVPGVPAEIDSIVARALNRDRTRRYASAATLAEDLERTVRGVYGASELAAELRPLRSRSEAHGSARIGASAEPAAEPSTQLDGTETAIDESTTGAGRRGLGRRRQTPARRWILGGVLVVAVVAVVGARVPLSGRDPTAARAIPPAVSAAATSSARGDVTETSATLLVTVDVPDARIVVDGSEIASAADSARIVVAHDGDHEVVVTAKDGRTQRRTVHVAGATVASVAFKFAEPVASGRAPATSRLPIAPSPSPPRRGPPSSAHTKPDPPAPSGATAKPPQSPFAPVDPFQRW